MGKHTFPWNVGVSPKDVTSDFNKADGRSLAVAFSVKGRRTPGINRSSITPSPVTPVNCLQVWVKPAV